MGHSLAVIEGKMKIGALYPGDLCVDSSDPMIFDCVVAWTEVKSKSVSVQRNRSLQVGNFQDDRH